VRGGLPVSFRFRCLAAPSRCSAHSTSCAVCVCSGVWAPFLARVFTAIGRTGRLPDGFTLGCVAPIPKGTLDPQDPASYRPITLLNADYKLLTRVLATRFATAMQDTIGSEQTAFLPGRAIGDGVALTQLVDAALALEGRPGAAVFLDIAKAYDTVDRGFLLSVMEAMGAGAGMQQWVGLLLQDTRAGARIEGCYSTPVRWEAGVRQGCPLSPCLYLFVAQALACWLRADQGLGVEVAGTRIVSAHHADDTRVFMHTLAPQHVLRLLRHMQVFARTSGQCMHPAKSVAVPLGTMQHTDPGLTQDIPVRPTHIALGVEVTAVPVRRVEHTRAGLRVAVRPPPEDSRTPLSPAWAARVQGVRALGGMIQGLHLSAMGRGMAVSAYALSTVLYHAQHEGLPEAAADALTQVVAKAVDRPSRRLRGLRTTQVGGTPAQGGFGALPVLAHTRARHARWAGRLLRHLCPAPAQEGGEERATPLWVVVAAHVLRGVCPGLHPAQTLLLAALSTPQDAAQGRLSLAPMQRVFLPWGPLLFAGQGLQAVGAAGEQPALRFAAPQPGHDPAAWLLGHQHILAKRTRTATGIPGGRPAAGTGEWAAWGPAAYWGL
jgi:hypothetical protein